MSFNVPLSSARASRLIEIIPVTSDATVVDAGCGDGDFLIEYLKHSGSEGLGIDIDSSLLKLAREKASQRIPDLTCTFRKGDLTKTSLKANAFDLAICLGASHAFGTGEEAFPTCLEKMIKAVRADGCLLIGEGYWKQEPDPEYLELIGEPVGIYRTHEENIALAESLGLLPLYAATSTTEEWDAFEDAFSKKVHAMAKENPDDPDKQAKRERAREWREGYEKWGRTTMGFGFYVFRKLDDE